MPKPVQTKFGQYSIAFYSDEKEVVDYLTRHFEKNLSDTFPDISVLLKLDTTTSPECIKPGSLYEYLVEDKTFDFGPGLINGIWDEATRTCKIKVASFLFAQDHIWLFDRYLCRLYYTLCDAEKNHGCNEIIVHCAGIARNGAGYLFFGPPESGKSTIAGFAGKYDKVLHDDMNIVSMNKGKILLQGVPFNPKLIERESSCMPLSMMFSLNQAEVTSVEALSPSAAFKKLAPETVLPQTVIDQDKRKSFEYLLYALKKLCTTVPCYNLYFKKDASFWDEIKKMESNNGRN